MFRGWRRATTTRSQGSPLVAAEQVVRTAEAIVSRAWAEELVRRRENLDQETRSAHEACERAYQRLTAAQRSGDPKKIRQSQAGLEFALAAGRACAVERDQAAAMLEEQMEVLRRATEERLRAAAARVRRPHRSAITAALPAPPPAPQAEGRLEGLSTRALWCGLRWWRWPGINRPGRRGREACH